MVVNILNSPDGLLKIQPEDISTVHEFITNFIGRWVETNTENSVCFVTPAMQQIALVNMFVYNPATR